MLTIWQKRQLWVIQTGFFYLPDFPLGINKRNGTLEKCFRNSKVANISLLVLIGINQMTAILITIFALLKWTNGRSEGEIDAINLISLLLALAILVFTTEAAIFFKNREAIFGMNQLSLIDTKIKRGNER